MNKESEIVVKALEMFNERGIEYVGLRELAAALGIRVGNLTYYFPTKDDLVNRLAQDLSRLNEQIVGEEPLSLFSFLERFRKVFANHLQYRCLLLSIVHLMEQNKVLSAAYKETEKKRYLSIVNSLSALQESDYLTPEADIDFLVSVCTLTARFWLSEASLSFSHLSPGEQIKHYVRLLAKLFLPYATEKGSRDAGRFLAGL
ncbi:TetR/AcrR family transcriptional regulator [Spirosoma aureum]|uniref:TetR/AcrR family transcriptional regulator n=1 Tax=Spirosoma aureum TaxID=2692134 RepID=A0A6G9ANF3_9BACT|nr:TetR/AcrR family transcriptional regulator [Spirosoma aureum]QIP13805.1 TetR/AcrR family transcriptional regulator [Spirosoma aureum]